MWEVTHARRLFIKELTKQLVLPFHEKVPRYTIAPETHQRGNDEMRLDLPKCRSSATTTTNSCLKTEKMSHLFVCSTSKNAISPVALQLRAPPKVSARAPAHRSYHFRGVKLKSCIKKIHHNLYISKQANVRIKHADTEGASHKKFGTDARVQ